MKYIITLLLFSLPALSTNLDHICQKKSGSTLSYAIDQSQNSVVCVVPGGMYGYTIQEFVY